MQISQKQMLEHFIPIFEKHGKKYKKKTLIKAKRATEGEIIYTRTSDGVETKNTAKVGDFLVVNQTSSSEKYLVNKQSFEKKYELKGALEKGWACYSSKSYIWAIEFSEENLLQLGQQNQVCFEADWGEDMIIKKGDFLVAPPELNEVYRIAKKEFGETYQLL